MQKFMLFGCIWRTEMRAMKGEGKKFLRNLSPAVEDKYSLKANIHYCRDTLISQDTHFWAEFFSTFFNSVFYKFFLTSKQASGLIHKYHEQIVLNCQISHSLSSVWQHLELASHCATCCIDTEKKGSLALLYSNFFFLWVLSRPRCKLSMSDIKDVYHGYWKKLFTIIK